MHALPWFGDGYSEHQPGCRILSTASGRAIIKVVQTVCSRLLHAADEVIIAFLCAGIIFTTNVFSRHRYLLLYVQIIRRKTILSDQGYVAAINAAN